MRPECADAVEPLFDHRPESSRPGVVRCPDLIGETEISEQRNGSPTSIIGGHLPYFRLQEPVLDKSDNLYNNANLLGYSGDLTIGGFGQPTARATQVFGSGGPRAFQLAVKIAF